MGQITTQSYDPKISTPNYYTWIKLWVPWKLIALMNQYWWGNIHKAGKALPSLVQSITREATAPRHFKFPDWLLESFGRWISHILMDIIHLSHGLSVFSLDPGYCLQQLKVPLKKSIPTKGTPVKLHNYRSENPFYWSGAWTSRCCLTGFTTFPLH